MTLASLFSGESLIGGVISMLYKKEVDLLTIEPELI